MARWAIAAQCQELASYHSYVGPTAIEASVYASPRWSLTGLRNNMSSLFRPVGLGTATRPTSKLNLTYNKHSVAGSEKKKIISRWRGYHGSGLMTGSLTGLEAVSQEVRPAAQPGAALHRSPLLLIAAARSHTVGGAVRRALRKRTRSHDRSARGRRHHRRLQSASRFWEPAASCRRPKRPPKK